eukprot:15465784-Alexandrium_andersonii.AAC.1
MSIMVFECGVVCCKCLPVLWTVSCDSCSGGPSSQSPSRGSLPTCNTVEGNGAVVRSGLGTCPG